MKKLTKIVTTVSDIRCDVEFIRGLYKAGMNVVRCNTAHMDFEGIGRIVKNTREVSEKIALLVDTKGPEIRTTSSNDIPVVFKTGNKIIVKGDPTGISTSECLYVSYPDFVKDLSVGKQIRIDDGEINLRVIEKTADHLLCEVENDGSIDGRKSVNIPGVSVNLPSLTEKDKKFVLWAIEHNLDFIAHSFVRSKADVKEIQDILDAHNSPIKIIAKIENQEGVDNLDEILEVVYGVMVARGDLGIEVPFERIPLIQRQMIRKCVEAKRPVIVATQMLHSMIKNPSPTRAEVTDIANAIYYRTDAIMLSGETTYGKYPVEAVQAMTKIAKEVEAAKDSRNDIPVPFVKHEITAYLAETAVGASRELPIKAILTDSFTGKTARYLAAFRSPVPVYALSYEARVGRELALSYGVFPQLMEEGKSKSEIIKKTIEKLLGDETLQLGDLIAYIGGSFGIGGGTSFLEIVTVDNLMKKIDSYIG